MSAGKRKRKRVKYKTITFKLSARQKKSLYNYCKARRTTPNKLVKKVLKPYLYGYDAMVSGDIKPTPNQLDLFEED